MEHRQARFLVHALVIQSPSHILLWYGGCISRRTTSTWLLTVSTNHV